MTNYLNAPTWQVTEWGDANETVEMVIDSQIMKVPYRAYLQSEVDRWAGWGRFRSPRESWIKQNEKGEMAMFSWTKYMRPVSEETEDGV